MLFLVYEAASNAIENLQRAHIASGFGFWDNTAGFDISQTLIEFNSTPLRPMAAPSGSACSTRWWSPRLGIVIRDHPRLHRRHRPAVEQLAGGEKPATGYVETIRNIPLLLQLLFWYNAVLKALPDTRESYNLPFHSFLNNRGFVLPKPIGQSGERIAVAADPRRLDRGIYLSLSGPSAGRRRPASKRRYFWSGAAMVIVPAALYILIFGFPYTFDIPQRGRFNLTGGLEVGAGIRRAAVRVVDLYRRLHRRGGARGHPRGVARPDAKPPMRSACKPGIALRLIVLPQAMRVIIPPLTSQYLNLTKNSSLAVAIGYPDLVQIFTGTVLNQTGQAVEVVAITMAVYLTISLTTSLAMNIYNSRIALVER